MSIAKLLSVITATTVIGLATTAVGAERCQQSDIINGAPKSCHVAQAEGLKDRMKDPDGLKDRMKDADGLKDRMKDPDGLKDRMKETDGLKDRVK